MIALVTGFVPLPNHPRSEAEYRKLGERLRDLPFTKREATCLMVEMRLEHCWLHQFLKWRGGEITWSVSDNPRKNTLDYLCVQAQKAEFLSEAARGFERADVFVWVDFGIFHLPGMTEEIIVDFARRAKHETMITIPGCWDRSYEYNDDHPCWRFCGGVMIVPRQFIFEFEVAWKMEYMRWINETNRLSWEVNTLARMEQRGYCLLNWFKADHNVTMFTNYRGRFHETENRDGVRTH